MSKQPLIKQDGVIVEALSNAMFRVKLENGHHKSSESGVWFFPVVTIMPVSFIEYSKVSIPSAAWEFPVSHAPPGNLPIHILHCTYRI